MAKHSTPKPADTPRAAAASAQSPDSDAEVFRAAVRDVKPLKHVPKSPAAAPPRSHKPKRLRKPSAAPVEAFDLDTAMPLVVPDADAVSGADALTFQRPGVRTQVVRRLRRGLIPIEAELDLHGLSQSAARIELAQFLELKRLGGCRCVRIVHGKGYRSGTRGPVLKIAVDSWLRRHHDVMAFTSARAVDGGTGAVYVLLRA